MKKLIGFISTTLLMLSSLTAFADTLPAPSGPVILTVSGNIEHTNNGDVAEFDRAMLMALEQGTILTRNPWADGLNRYQGPLGAALMEVLGADGDTLLLTALNDYSSEMPTSDLSQFGVVLAMSMNDQQLRIRDRGPLFVIYPFTDEPELNSELYHNRSVWQVNRIDVR
ncbi:MAG: hypothetical protein ABJ000_01735 [Saccharospirillum sp.]|uniref:hypothetical protein n=1 Tax=Saccharospirillum sp. TaxID=2033801 RepID=UPI00329845DA